MQHRLVPTERLHQTSTPDWCSFDCRPDNAIISSFLGLQHDRRHFAVFLILLSHRGFNSTTPLQSYCETNMSYERTKGISASYCQVGSQL